LTRLAATDREVTVVGTTWLTPASTRTSPASPSGSGRSASTCRTISYHQGDVIPDGPLLDILRAISADNRAGGWRRIKADAERNR
jgi:hypothetical protein